MGHVPGTRSEPASTVAALNAQPWSAPLIDGAIVPASSRRRLPEGLREEERRPYAEAEAAGKAAGMAAARKELDAMRAALDERARALQSMLDALGRPLAHVDEQVHEQIAMLAVRIASALVRRELRADPTQVIGIVRETVALLPASSRGVRVALHPDDAALVRERLAASGPEAAWSVVEDAVLARGDCRIYTDYAQIDARLETRLSEAIAALLGDERTLPRGGETG